MLPLDVAHETLRDYQPNSKKCLTAEKCFWIRNVILFNAVVVARKWCAPKRGLKILSRKKYRLMCPKVTRRWPLVLDKAIFLRRQFCRIPFPPCVCIQNSLFQKRWRLFSKLENHPNTAFLAALRQYRYSAYHDDLARVLPTIQSLLDVDDWRNHFQVFLPVVHAWHLLRAVPSAR